MFYMAEAALLTKGLSYSKHSGIIAAFWEHFVKPGTLPKSLHQALARAFDERNQGDYGFEAPFPSSEAEGVLSDARDFVEAVSRYLGSAA